MQVIRLIDANLCGTDDFGLTNSNFLQIQCRCVLSGVFVRPWETWLSAVRPSTAKNNAVLSRGCGHLRWHLLEAHHPCGQEPEMRRADPGHRSSCRHGRSGVAFFAAPI